MNKSKYLDQKSTILYNISKFNDRVYLLRAASVKLDLKEDRLVFSKKNTLDDLRIVDYIDAATIKKRFGKEVFWKYFYTKYNHDFYFITVTIDNKVKYLFLKLEEDSYSFEPLSFFDKIKAKIKK